MGILKIVGKIFSAALNKGRENMNVMNNARYNSGNLSDKELMDRVHDKSRSSYERVGAASALVDRRKNNT